MSYAKRASNKFFAGEPLPRFKPLLVEEMQMISEQTNLLSLQRLPARLTVNEAAWYLGFNSKEISILLAAKLLKPLGHPASNGQKYFASCDLERLSHDQEWLAKASDAVTKHWRKRNSTYTKP